jgi:hypothetical protein
LHYGLIFGGVVILTYIRAKFNKKINMVKKIIFSLLWIVSISFTGHAQVDSLENEFFIGVNGGIDYNINAYEVNTDPVDGHKYYRIQPQYNFGFDGSFRATRRIRPRLEFRYVNVKYGIDWSGTHYDFDPHTVVNISYFGINCHIDYLFIDTKKFQAFVSPGLRWELKSQVNLSSNHWHIDAGATMQRHPGSIAGGAVAMIFKYNITPGIGITLLPEYTYFCRRFAAGNEKQYQRANVNLGVEFKL